MDDALETLLEDEKDEDWLDLSPEGIEKEKTRWVLLDEAHLSLFVLWRNMSGMGGESLYDLWRLVGTEGSAALFRDFWTLLAREKRLKKRIERTGKGKRNVHSDTRPKHPKTAR